MKEGLALGRGCQTSVPDSNSQWFHLFLNVATISWEVTLSRHGFHPFQPRKSAHPRKILPMGSDFPSLDCSGFTRRISFEQVGHLLGQPGANGIDFRFFPRSERSVGCCSLMVQQPAMTNAATHIVRGGHGYAKTKSVWLLVRSCRLLEKGRSLFDNPQEGERFWHLHEGGWHLAPSIKWCPKWDL